MTRDPVRSALCSAQRAAYDQVHGVCVYRLGDLRRFADELVVALAPELFGAWDMLPWNRAFLRGRVKIQEASPHDWLMGRYEAEEALEGLETELPGFLPVVVEPAKKSDLAIPRVRVEIVCTVRGKRVREGGVIRVIGHELRYRVDGKDCQDLDAMRIALRNRVARHQRLPGVVLAPGAGTLYGDVAVVVTAIKRSGFQDIDFGSGQGSEK